jgi:UPF0716 family protein affecting phage T7 exclusion
MKNKILMKISSISGWLLLAVLVLYFISGYAMVREYGMNHLMSRRSASSMHGSLAALFFALLALHIVPYYYVRKRLKRMVILLLIVFILPVLGVYAVNKIQKQNISGAKPPAQVEQQPEQAGKNAAVQCEGCKRRCLIKPGETGECGQVKNVDGKLKYSAFP